MKKYKYFIVYSADSGSMTVTREYRCDKQIKSIHDIRDIEDEILKDRNMKNCQILNFKLLDIEIEGSEDSGK